MKRPLTGLAVAYAAGIGTASLLDWPPGPTLALAAILLLTFILCRHTRAAIPVMVGAVFAAGFLSCRQAVTPSARNIASQLPLRDQNAGLRGRVVSEADEHDRFRLRLSALETFDGWRAAEGTVLVHLATNHAMAVRYGDEFVCSALLRLPETAANPGGFDQRAWLAREQIVFTALVREQDTCRVLGHGGNPLTALSLRVRQYCERALCYGLEDEPKVSGVLMGMVIGNRDIPRETYEDFQRTGVMHVFSVSGLHVGLLAIVLVGALRLAQVPHRWCGLVGIPVLVIYVLATGARPGAVRALVMACVWLGGWILLRPTDMANTLATAALAILVCDPLQLFDGGYILSVAAVAALIALAGGTQERLRNWLAPDPFLAPRFVPRWRRWVSSGWSKLVPGISCSWAAWIGLVPMMAGYFHLFSPIALAANLIVVPVLGLLTGLGMAAVAVFGFWPWLTLTLNNAVFLVLSATIQAVAWLEQVPRGFLFVKTPPVWFFVLYYGALALWITRRQWWPGRRWVAGVSASVVTGLVLFTTVQEEAVELTVLHLNEGTAVFANVPGEQDDWLLDGGGVDGRQALLPFLRAAGVDRLGGIALTCKDKSHVTGLAEVITEVPVGQLILAETPSRSAPYWRWRQLANARAIPTRTVRAGDEWRARNLRFRVLNPPADAASARSDDNALVLLAELGPTRVLLVSDVGASVEHRLVAEHAANLRAAVLIKGNHGKEPSCTAELLNAVRPEYVVQSVSAWASRRYPDPRQREHVEQHGARLLRTDQTGAVTIRLTPRGHSIRTQRLTSAR